MKGRVFIVHGWGSNPESDWFPWLSQELLKLDYEPVTPKMPKTNDPRIASWINKLNTVVGPIRQSDVFIGHSIGCQTILRFINSSNQNQIINKVILVAPWWYLTLEGQEEKVKAKPWLKPDINFESTKSKINKIVCIFSDNDPVVPLDINVKFFKEKLDPEIIVESNMGHFAGDDNPKVTELQLLLNLLK